MYLDRRDTVSFARRRRGRGQQGRPTWSIRGRSRAGDRNIPHDGERMQTAAERYRTNKVTPLASTAHLVGAATRRCVAPASK